MRIANFFIIVFGTSLTYAHCKPANSFSTRLLPNDMIRVKKRQEDSSAGYLEQCGIVTFPYAQQGVVNVLAFLDSSWPYSHRQAIMLKMLNERLQRSGLPDTLFFVVNIDPSSARTIDNAEDDIEREAWLGVSPEEIDTFSDIVKTTDSLAMSMTSQIQLIQDNEDLEIWKDLGGSRDQVLVIDRCGKLTYQVIVPWSILHFPYVKAAILSTYKDEPCGPCDAIHNARDPFKHLDEVNLQIDSPSSDSGFNSTTEEYLQNDRDDHVSDVPESDLRNVLASFTTESGSTSGYFVTEAIDDVRETTTEFDVFDNSDNYSPTNFGVATENELTTLESSTLINMGDITKIESETTTISSIFADEEAIDDFTNTLTSHPISNDEIKSFYIKKISSFAQNSGDDPEAIEEKIETSSTNIISSHTTDSKYPVSYYETTENFYPKDDVKYKTVPETPKSNKSDIINSDLTNSEYLVSYDETTKNIYIIDDVKYTTTPETPKLNTLKVSTTPKKSMNSDDEKSSESSVEKEDTTISMNNNDNRLDNVADNIYSKNEFEDTIATETLESSTSSFFGIQEKSTDFYNENNTQSTIEKEDTSISINSDTIQLDGVALSSNLNQLATSENFMFDASTEETATLNKQSFVSNEKESNENQNSESLQDHFDDNSENQDTSQLSDMPLRIIMHAPHFHVDGDSTRMHEYLVLKTGSSDYHRHLASYDATRLYRGPQDFQETPDYFRKDEIERKNWPMSNIIYNKDESPGLYGEVADYWKNAGGQDNYDYNEETETSGIEQNTEEPSTDETIPTKSLPTKTANLTEDKEDSALSDESSYKIPERLQADFADASVTDKQIWSDEALNAEEEEKRNKLIAHYSKLLPWIYYVLDK